MVIHDKIVLCFVKKMYKIILLIMKGKQFMTSNILFITIVCWIFSISFFKPNTVINNKYNARVILFVLLIFTSIKVSLIESNDITDLYVYVNQLTSFSDVSLSSAFLISEHEPLFIILQWIIAQYTTSEIIFKVVIWILFSTLFLFSLKRMFFPGEVLIVFFSYTLYFIFFGYALNVMRQGLSISLLFIAISTFKNKKNSLVFYACIILAPLFHFSSIIFSTILFILRKKKISLKFTLVIWLLSAILFITDLNKVLLSSFLKFLPYNTYFNSSAISFYGGANKIEFLLFSLLFVLFGLLISKYFIKGDNNYLLVIKIFILFNSIFLLSGFVAFADRIAAYSWMLIPLLIWIPIFNREREKDIHNPIVNIFALGFFLAMGLITGSINIFLK